MEDIKNQIRKCAVCATRFSETHTKHKPKPVVWFESSARILIAGQAPGIRVHESGIPFDDRSGDRLRSWLGVDRNQFYDRELFSIVPMAFCFPGYNAKGHDLAPPKICATKWRSQVMQALPDQRLTLLIGGYAQKWHLGDDLTVTQRVQNWRQYGANVFVLPHPSWRNNSWIKKNSFFTEELLPELKMAVQRNIT